MEIVEKLNTSNCLKIGCFYHTEVCGLVNIRFSLWIISIFTFAPFKSSLLGQIDGCGCHIHTIQIEGLHRQKIALNNFDKHSFMHVWMCIKYLVKFYMAEPSDNSQ